VFIASDEIHRNVVGKYGYFSLLVVAIACTFILERRNKGQPCGLHNFSFSFSFSIFPPDSAQHTWKNA